jgi:NAD(P)-dependent dehydrogenase (short-subunit alcohol dehydrogenase family)
MPFDLTDRAVAVIGAGSGIGEAVARLCAAQGARVACLDIDETAARRVAGELTEAGARAADHDRVDITDAVDVARALEALADAAGPLHGVVCTPG